MASKKDRIPINKLPKTTYSAPSQDAAETVFDD